MGISAQLNPTISTPEYSTNITDVKSYIQNKLLAGEKNIVIPKGVYLFDVSDYKPLILDKISDITIDGSGSDFICNRNTRAIDLKDCQNVILKNFTIDYDPLPFSQGKIVAVGTDTVKWFDVYIFEGYDLNNIALNDTELFDKSTLELKKNSSAIYQSYVYDSLEKNESTRIVRIRRKKGSPDYFKETVGDLVVFSNKKDPNALGHTIYSESNVNCTLSNITLYSSPSFGFYEFGCTNTIYDSCQIKRKADDPRVSFPRLRSGNSDGIDCRGSLAGPHIRNCTLTHNSDDCIAISGRFYIVIQEAFKKLAIMSYLPMDIQAGDSIKIVGRDGILRQNKVLSVSRGSSANYNPNLLSDALHAFDKINPGIYDLHWGKLIYEMELADITNAQIGEVIYDKNRTCSNFSLINNYVGFNRARGALIKSSDGIITGNTFESCQLPGLSVAPELYYMEAGYSENLYIADNIIRNCNFGYTRSGWEQAGALNVSAINTDRIFSQPAGFKNIKIEKNLITGSPRPSVVLTSIDGGFFQSNNIESDISIVRYNGSFLGVKNDVDLWQTNNRNFTISDTLAFSKIEEKKIMPIFISINNDEKVVISNNKKIISMSIYNLQGGMVYSDSTILDMKVTLPKSITMTKNSLFIVSLIFEDNSTYKFKII